MHQIHSGFVRFNSFICVLAVAAFTAACAQVQPVAQDSVETPVATNPVKPASQPVKAPAPVVLEEKKVDYSTLNPVPIPFEQMSIKLDTEDREIISQLVSRAQAAQRIVLTGYCDRQQIGNAKDAAIARAVAVREEFVKQGVSGKKIRIKYVTEAAGKHMVEIQF